MTSDAARRRFNKMVLRQLDGARVLARWLIDSRTDVEDVVHDACMRALASLETAVVAAARMATNDRGKFGVQLAGKE